MRQKLAEANAARVMFSTLESVQHQKVVHQHAPSASERVFKFFNRGRQET